MGVAGKEHVEGRLGWLVSGAKGQMLQEIPRSLRKKGSVGQAKGLGFYYGCSGNSLRCLFLLEN